MSGVIPNFGPEPDSPDKNRAAKAEARRPEVKHMQTHSTVSNLPDSIANTVTVFDPKETRRAEIETARMQDWLEHRLKRGKREVFSEAVTITPTLARLILQRNPENRALNKTRLAEIKADIEGGHWMFNGESIIVADDGNLNDGQHRLYICRDHNLSLRTMIVFGVPRKARHTTDQGSARTSADFLSMGSRTDTVVLAAVARLYLQFLANGRVNPNAKTGSKRHTKADIVGCAIDNEQGFRRSIEYTKGSKSLGPHSLVAVCHFILDKINQTSANTFIGRAIDGTNLTKGDPIHMLRSRMADDPKMRPADRFEAIMRAWNLFRGERSASHLRLTGKTVSVDGWKGEA